MRDPKQDSAAGKAGEAGGEHPEPAGPESPATSEAPEQAAGGNAGLIVGVGASAGGLEAFTELLRNLPADTGMAFVLVQHLDPHHQSILAELLGNYTRMPVLQVNQEVHVERDHVYVIPPNATMVLTDGSLRVSRPAHELSHKRKPVDEFLCSLAETMRNRAIGVILSGAATDGTLGLKAIKAEGGITFAQDSTAKFDGMPRNAVAAGAVDFVLSPKAIADELVRLAHHPMSISPPETVVGESPAMEKVLTVVRSRVGIDFRLYKQGTVQRRVARRVALRTVETLEEYLEILRREPDEVDALVEDLLIKVTEFFRDAPEFEALKASVFPRIAKERPENEPVRIWVPGCSTGEEVYSIAISLMEYLEAEGISRSVQIFGSDASEAVIAKARAACYDEGAISAIDPERLRRFFTRVDTGFQINRNIRDMCIFSRHVLGADPPLSRMDLVSCRNMLIYFAPALQQRVIDTLAYALRPGGFLFVGRSEGTGRLSEFFDLVDEQYRIFTRRPTIDTHALNLIPNTSWAPATQDLQSVKPQGRGAETGTVRSFVDHMLLSRYGPSGVVVDKDLKIVEYRGDINPYVHTQEGAANLNLLETLREDLAMHLRSSIADAQQRNSTIRLDEIQVRQDRTFHFVRITVIPVRIPSSDPYSVILFEDLREPAERKQHGAAPSPKEVNPPDLKNPQRHIEHLERELTSSREYLQSIIEELRSTNEEAQSANEELQSSNEELQTTKEELQASNEELSTMNAEMQSRNVELGSVNDDLLNFVSSINTPILMVSNDLRIRRATPAAEKLLHLIPADIGRPVSDIRLRINAPSLEDILKDVLDGLKPHEQEVQDADGRDYLMRVRPYRTGTNRIDGAVLMLTDITDLKRGMREAGRARDYAAAIVDTVREPLLVLDEKLIARSANRAFYDFFQTGPERVEGRGVYDIVDRQLDLPRLRQLLQDLLKGQSELRDIEIEQEFRPAGSRVLQLNARQVSADGSILLAFEDITERKRAAEARYRRLFESARDGIIIIDEPTGEILDINPYVEQLFGYPRRELVGRKLWEIEPARDTPGLQMMLEQARDQRHVRSSDAQFRTKDGRAIQTETVANLYHEGDRRAIQLNIRDLTERRKFERELQDAQRLESLGLLAGGIAHDFNNLLTGILGNASLIYGELRSDDPWRMELRSILSASERASDLTRQLLAYAGKGRFIVEQVDLSGMVRDVVMLLKSSIPKTVDLRLDLADDMPAVEADPSQMQQLIMNLVINAGEAIGEGRPGTIEIRTGERELTVEEIRESFVSEALRPGPYASLEVKDTGIGMDEATRAKVFDPFFTTKFTGRGLGLAAVSGILRALGGAIRVYSTPGQGSSFYVLLPAAAAAQRPMRAKPAPRLERGSGTILVVDDENTVRQTAGGILKKLGYEVLVAENGQAGVDILREQGERISLVFLDLTMPVMGGEQAFDSMRALRKDVPIVLMSGYDETEAAARTAGKHFTGFLQKPFTVGRLSEAVASALRPKEQE